MDKQTEQVVARRQFLRTAACCAGACALTAVTAGLIAKAGPKGFACLDNQPCRDCSLEPSCSLPAAVAARQRPEANRK